MTSGSGKANIGSGTNTAKAGVNLLNASGGVTNIEATAEAAAASGNSPILNFNNCNVTIINN